MASQVNLLASAAFITDPLYIFVIITQAFFSVLLIFLAARIIFYERWLIFHIVA